MNYNNYIDMLQLDLDTLGEWAGENAMKINTGKSKSVCSYIKKN
jgi:hypothetical protein